MANDIHEGFHIIVVWCFNALEFGLSTLLSDNAFQKEHVNHPSGDPEPSEADKRITHRLRDALSLVDIRTLDHVVVASEGCVSLAERGYL
jgi:hypothetical protein